MEQPETFITKDYRNKSWKASTRFMLAPDLVLNVKTSKHDSGTLTTTASVARIDGAFEVFKLYQDLYVRLGSTHQKRITAKIVEAQHMEWLRHIDAVIDQARKQYGLI